MPTENRRVAAYLPKNIDEQLDRFKQERGIKGDSSALITILEEFFGVSREMAYSSSSQLNTEVFKSDLLSELRSELLSLKSEIKSELLSELKSELPSVDHPKQLSFPSNQEVDQPVLESELPINPLSNSLEQPSELPSEPDSRLQPLNEVELAERWRLKDSRIIRNKRSNSRHNPQVFIDWSIEKDPENVAWSYRKEMKLYYPISPDSQEF
jgi:hypothetical protein